MGFSPGGGFANSGNEGRRLEVERCGPVISHLSKSAKGGAARPHFEDVVAGPSSGTYSFPSIWGLNTPRRINSWVARPTSRGLTSRVPATNNDCPLDQGCGPMRSATFFRNSSPSTGIGPAALGGPGRRILIPLLPRLILSAILHFGQSVSSTLPGTGSTKMEEFAPQEGHVTLSATGSLRTRTKSPSASREQRRAPHFTQSTALMLLALDFWRYCNVWPQLGQGFWTSFLFGTRAGAGGIPLICEASTRNSFRREATSENKCSWPALWCASSPPSVAC